MNLRKSYKDLSQISILIAREGADPVVGGKIYVGVICSSAAVQFGNLSVDLHYA